MCGIHTVDSKLLWSKCNRWNSSEREAYSGQDSQLQIVLAIQLSNSRHIIWMSAKLFEKSESEFQKQTISETERSIAISGQHSLAVELHGHCKVCKLDMEKLQRKANRTASSIHWRKSLWKSNAWRVSCSQSRGRSHTSDWETGSERPQTNYSKFKNCVGK